MSTIELLAPVGHREGLLAAVTNGADAIYVGGAAFGARKEAAFTNEELIEVIKFSHLHNVKVYVTVNTTIFDQELEALKEYIHFLYLNDVDAIIVQDIGVAHLVKQMYPDFELHFSTQMTLHNTKGVEFAKQFGADRVVVARENTLEEICNDLGVNKEVGKNALKILQSLEPCGIGSRNLKECLLIQLKNKGILDEIIKEIILKYLEYIADCKYNYIAKELKITPKKVQAYGDIIKALEPKPARGYYTGEEIKFIIPDAYIVKIRGEYSVIMNKDIIPNITINNLYKQEILNGKNKREVEYVKEKVNDAINLINNVEQRNTTILKLLECIVKKQKEYFENGQEYLKPMTLRELADEMRMHESTVSRAIKDKYILTSRGTIKIKDLFCNRIISSGIEGEDVSTNTIKNKIKQLIKLENKSKPLSDQAICDLLNKEDIAISRRTVAKYREELDIKSSAKRKRF